MDVETVPVPVSPFCVPDEESVIFALMILGATHSANPLYPVRNITARPSQSQSQSQSRDHEQSMDKKGHKTQSADAYHGALVSAGGQQFRRAQSSSKLFTPWVDVAHALPCQDGTHAVFATTLLGADIIRAAYSSRVSAAVPEVDTSVVLAGEWVLTRRRTDGALELGLKRRFVFAGDVEGGIGSSGEEDDYAYADAAAAPPVPLVHMTIAEFLVLARTANPPWLRDIYATARTEM